MGFARSPWEYPVFEMRDLHKKIGQLVFTEPTESDIAEGNFMEQLWFRDEKQNLYLIHERDVRQPETTKKVGE